MIAVVSERCPQNHRCPLVRRCKQNAISQEGFKAPTVDNEECVECMVCVRQCPYKAFEKREDEE